MVRMSKINNERYGPTNTYKNKSEQQEQLPKNPKNLEWNAWESTDFGEKGKKREVKGKPR